MGNILILFSQNSEWINSWAIQCSNFFLKMTEKYTSWIYLWMLFGFVIVSIYQEWNWKFFLSWLFLLMLTGSSKNLNLFSMCASLIYSPRLCYYITMSRGGGYTVIILPLPTHTQNKCNFWGFFKIIPRFICHSFAIEVWEAQS